MLSSMPCVLLLLWEKADYQDFFLVSKKMAMEQLEKAEKLIEILEPFLERKWRNQ